MYIKRIITRGGGGRGGGPCKPHVSMQGSLQSLHINKHYCREKSNWTLHSYKVTVSVCVFVRMSLVRVGLCVTQLSDGSAVQ